MTLFLKDQFERKKNRIVEIISENKELNNSISHYKDLKEKLKILEQEVSEDPKVEFLKDILETSIYKNKFTLNHYLH